ncbi:MAG: hypothetical protein WD200_00155 [Candidatus Andersenbacteria bacterium]
MDLLQTIKEGTFANYGIPKKVVDTLLSNLFFFEDRVLKVYKHKKAFYGDLADFDFRKEFYSEDFFWNHRFAPEIYLELLGVKQTVGSFSVVSFKEADDFLIEMAVIDDTQNLTNLLIGGTITAKHMQAVTGVLTEKLRALTGERKERLSHLFERGWPALQEEALDDLRQWAYLAEEYIPRKNTDAMIDLLKATAAKEPYFVNYDESLLSVAIDNNCDNLLLFKGKPSFIDIMTPKENWRVSDEYFTIVRTAVDAYVLGNKELGDAVYATYENYREAPPKDVTLIYEIRSGLIQWAYRHIISRHAQAQKYADFVLWKVKELQEGG